LEKFRTTMSEYYKTVSVDIKDKSQIEQMGTKTKFWFLNASTNERWLFKYNRPKTGEDWSEKIASEIAELLEIPHAIVELAECEGKKGVLSKDFTEETKRGNLVHGNELLTAIDPDYPSEQYRKVSQHSIDNITQILKSGFAGLPRGYSAPSNVTNAVDLFLGYLTLDALIGNIDRHHENWGVLVYQEKSKWYAELAPTYDHASSLGRELQEEKRISLLSGKIRNANIETYANKARSAIYLNVDDKKALPTIEAFIEFSKHSTEARKVWLDKLAGIVDDTLIKLVKRVPRERLSTESAEFVYQLLLFNKQRLLDIGF